MIEKTLRTADSKITVQIPTALSELTLGQMIALQEAGSPDDLDVISILSGVPKADLANVKSFGELRLFDEHIMALCDRIKHLYDNDTLPRKITFMTGGREIAVDVIHNLSVEPAGAFFAAREIIAGEIGEHISLYGDENWKDNFQPSLSACCLVLAHYFYCRVTQKRYDEYEAEAFCEEVKNLKVPEALPLARHFFTCYPSLSKPKTDFWQRLRRYWKRKQGYKPLRSLNI